MANLRRATQATVYIVDDDPAVRDAMRWLMEQVKLKTKVCSSANEFLASYVPGERACVVLDVRMPGMSGLELQERLNAAGALLPIVIITGHGDVPLAVRAMKSGAVEFLQKPFNDQVLLDTVQTALANYESVWDKIERRNRYSESLSTLTKRELEVLDLLRKGKPNKVVASVLDISVRTVEGHRASIMAKTGASSLGQLIDMLYSSD